MKSNILAISFFFTVSLMGLQAQTINFNQIVVPEGQRTVNFEEYLVQLAWLNSPETQILNYKKSKEAKEVELKRTEWMDDVNFMFNINEVSLENVIAPDPNNFVLYPLYQFSAAVSLGSFTNTKKEKEIEAFDVKIAEMESNTHKMEIRAETLTRYHIFLLSIETLKVRIKAEEDSNNTYNLAQQQFKNADLEMKDLLQASASYNGTLERKLIAETDVELTKLALEEIIGVRWETAKRVEERMRK